MDLPLPVRSVSVVDYSTPLHVDTNIVYDIDEENFPGLFDISHTYEPSLIISSDYLDIHMLSCGQNSHSESAVEIQDDLYELLDSVDLTQVHTNCQTENIIEAILDEAAWQNEAGTVPRDLDVVTLNYIQENDHSTVDYSTPEVSAYQKTGRDIISPLAKCRACSMSRSSSRCWVEDKTQKRNKKRHLWPVSDDRCSKRRKLSTSGKHSTEVYRNVIEDLNERNICPHSVYTTDQFILERRIFSQMNYSCDSTQILDFRQI